MKRAFAELAEHDRIGFRKLCLGLPVAAISVISLVPVCGILARSAARKDATQPDRRSSHVAGDHPRGNSIA
jgi:hypothetical protein